MRMVIVMLVAAAFGCAGDSPASSNKCTGELYDPCIAEHQCISGLCRNFAADSFQVCSQACDAANPCPTGGECDVDVCKPAAPKDCELEDE
jgi:hypothetical protein